MHQVLNILLGGYLCRRPTNAMIEPSLSSFSLSSTCIRSISTVMDIINDQGSPCDHTDLVVINSKKDNF
jgi:hypothetical protein